MPPRGFEPLISALKGRRPGPLDDGGQGSEAAAHASAESVPGKEGEQRARSKDLALAGSGSWIRTNDLRVMSPTSYHCSIPRCTSEYSRGLAEKSSARPWHRPIFPGSCPRSIVGAGTFHFRVRYGNGWVHSALATKATALHSRRKASGTPLSDRPGGLETTGPIVRGVPEPSRAERWIVSRSCRPGVVHELNDEPSAISTASLKPLPAVHARPINQVVYLGPYPINSVGTLIFGRASRLDAFSGYPCRTSATQRCPWRDN